MPAGRKPWKPSKEQRDDVMLMRAAGMSKPKIAAVIGTTETALVRECSVELDSIHYRKKLKQLRNLEKAADKGNVAAQKALLTIYSKGELVFDLIGRPPKQKEAEPEPKPVKLGKKAEELIDARKGHKGTTWESHLTKQ